MTEYSGLLKKYGSTVSGMSSPSIPLRDEDTNRQFAESFCREYWLSRKEYTAQWQAIQQDIFDPKAKYLPDMMFKPELVLIPLSSGFGDEEFFLYLQKVMKLLGDQEFVMVQNTQSGNPEEIRFKFPAGVNWKELLNGGGMSEVLFGFYGEVDCEYYLYGDSGAWGMYSSPDRDPYYIDIIGCKPEYEAALVKIYDGYLDKELIEITKRNLPPLYKEWEKNIPLGCPMNF